MNDYEKLKSIAFKIANGAVSGDLESELAARRSLIELACNQIEMQGISPQLLEVLADFHDSAEMSELLYRLGIAHAKHLGKNAATIKLSLADLIGDSEAEEALEILQSVDGGELDQFEQETLATLKTKLLTIKK